MTHVRLPLLFQGGDLYRALARDITHSWYGRGRQIAADITHGLHFLHASGVVHRFASCVLMPSRMQRTVAPDIRPKTRKLPPEAHGILLPVACG